MTTQAPVTPDHLEPPGGDGGAKHAKASVGAGRRRFRYTLPGAWVALLFVCLSFTPSLLPRPAFFQGFVCGVNGAIGYGIGVVGAWLWRQFADRPARPARRRSWQAFFVVGAVVLVAA